MSVNKVNSIPKIDNHANLLDEIKELKRKKNAILISHYYQTGNIQDISDFVGDSLAMAQYAEKSNAEILIVSGVHFMAETAKILCPEKKVILPDLNAGCSLADSCPTPAFAEFISQHPGHTIISYVNTTAEIKMLSDIICTSSNAKEIVESLPIDEKIIFGPDKNLGNYINSITGRNMVLWNGSCHVHQEFSLQRIIELKNENPDSLIIAHPECNAPILQISDHIGSTSSLLRFTIQSKAKKFIVVTESGIIHQMQKSSPNKVFIPAPPEDIACGCNDCSYMKLNTIEKVYQCLKNESPEIIMDIEVIRKAYKSIRRMMDISNNINK